MPTYRFKDNHTGEIWEELMTISEMEELIKSDTIELLPPTQMNIVSSVGSIDSKTDSGFKEVLSKAAEAHPNSELAKQHKRRSTKEVKTQQVVEKHRRRQRGKK